MGRKFKNIGRNVFSSIIAMVLMFSVIATMGVIFFKTTLIDEDTYKNVFDKVGTYDKIVESINSDVVYTLTVNNLPQDTLKKLITREEVVKIIDDTTDSVINFIRGEDEGVIALDTSVYEKRVNNGINKFLRDNNMYLNESQTRDIDSMRQTILNILSSELQLINFHKLFQSEGMIQVAKMIGILDKSVILIVMLIFDAILAGVFFLIWKKRKVRSYAWLGYSLVAAGMVVFLVSFSGYLSGFYDYVIIAIPYVAETVAGIIKRGLLDMSIIGLVTVVIGIFSISVYWKHLYRRYRSNNERTSVEVS